MKKDNVIFVIYKFVEFIGVELYDVEEILRVMNFIKMKEKFNQGYMELDGSLFDMLVF